VTFLKEFLSGIFFISSSFLGFAHGLSMSSSSTKLAVDTSYFEFMDYLSDS